MTIKTLLLLAMAAVALFYLFVWARAIWQERNAQASIAPSPVQIGIGAIANFFDTFGIGSFATTTAMWRSLKMIRDEYLPGTLNVGHTLPTVAQAFIFIQVVEVDIRTLLALIVAAVLGMTIGAKYVAHWPRRRVQYGMSIAQNAAYRSSDLSRQIGAVIFSESGEILSQGCNEVPKAFGGSYWDGELPDHRDIKIGNYILDLAA